MSGLFDRLLDRGAGVEEALAPQIAPNFVPLAMEPEAAAGDALWPQTGAEPMGDGISDPPLARSEVVASQAESLLQATRPSPEKSAERASPVVERTTRIERIVDRETQVRPLLQEAEAPAPRPSAASVPLPIGRELGRASQPVLPQTPIATRATPPTEPVQTLGPERVREVPGPAAVHRRPSDADQVSALPPRPPAPVVYPADQPARPTDTLVAVPRPLASDRPRDPAPDLTPTAPPVTIRIDRIEINAPAPASPQKPARSPARRGPDLTLDAYLDGNRGGRR